MLSLAFPDINPVALEFGPIVVRWYALAYIAGITLGWRYANHLIARPPHFMDRVALDDFGAVSSSQGRVKALCPDIIKIDRSLLLDYMQGDNGRLQQVLAQGWQIGSRMLIEGIETAEQLAAMQSLGLELYQGFYLGMPAELRVEELV